MKRDYWAQRGAALVGPHASREEALKAFVAAHPWRGKAYDRKADICTGYGSTGPFMDIRWHRLGEV